MWEPYDIMQQFCFWVEKFLNHGIVDVVKACDWPNRPRGRWKRAFAFRNRCPIMIPVEMYIKKKSVGYPSETGRFLVGKRGSYFYVGRSESRCRLKRGSESKIRIADLSVRRPKYTDLQPRQTDCSRMILVQMWCSKGCCPTPLFAKVFMVFSAVPSKGCQCAECSVHYEFCTLKGLPKNEMTLFHFLIVDLMPGSGLISITLGIESFPP